MNYLSRFPNWEDAIAHLPLNPVSEDALEEARQECEEVLTLLESQFLHGLMTRDWAGFNHLVRIFQNQEGN